MTVPATQNYAAQNQTRSGPSAAVGALQRQSRSPLKATAEFEDSGPDNTPRNLRLWMGITIVMCVLLAVLSTLTMHSAATAGERAASDAAQLVRLNTIRTNLLKADAYVTTAYLAPGANDNMQAYHRTIAETSGLIAEASAAKPGDLDSLAQVNQALIVYTADLAQLQVTYKADTPIATKYLSAGSAAMRSSTLPVLDQLIANYVTRTEDQSLGANPGFLTVSLLTLGVSLSAMVWTASRFRRVVNLGLVAGCVLVAIIMVSGSAAMTGLRSAAMSASDSGTVSTIDTLGQIRVKANETKVFEAMTLLSSEAGAGTAAGSWRTTSLEVRSLINSLPTDQRAQLTTAWQRYLADHENVDALLVAKKVPEAKAAAVRSLQTDGTFEQFEEAVASIVTLNSQQSVSGFQQAARPPAYLRYALGPLALVAAVAAGWGLRQRLREYL